MKVSEHVKDLLRQLADCGAQARFLNRELNIEFEKMGLPTDSQEFIDAFSYVENDSYIDGFLQWIEEDVE